MVKYNDDRKQLSNSKYFPYEIEEDKGEIGENLVRMRLALLPEERYKVLNNVTFRLIEAAPKLII